jgi:hypothetical protein
MSAFNYSLDDSSGEALGDGLDSSAIDLSGADFSFDDTLQGSPIDLGGDGETGSVFDGAGLSLEDQFNLSGASDPMASDSLDSGEWDTNGAGSAASTHPLTASSSDGLNTILGGVAKFGASIGQLFARGGASTQPVYAGAPANLNPNRTLVRGVSSGNALLLVCVVVVIGAAVALGGKNV